VKRNVKLVKEMMDKDKNDYLDLEEYTQTWLAFDPKENQDYIEA